MKTAQDIKLAVYSPQEHGLHQGKRRLTRVHFQDAHPPKAPDKTYRALLPTVYEAMSRSPLAPIMPDKIRAEWSGEEEAFVLHGPGLTGFGVLVFIRNTQDGDHEPDATQRDVEALHGAPLPRLGR